MNISSNKLASLALAFLATPVAAQPPSPTSFTVQNGAVTIPATIGNTCFGFGDVGQRVLFRTTTGSLGYFPLGTTGNSNFVELAGPASAQTIRNIVWERGGTMGEPQRAYVVQNSTQTVPMTPLVAAMVELLIAPNGTFGGVNPLATISTSTTEDWRVEGVRTGNNHFLLRRNSLLNTGNVFWVGRTGSPQLLTPVAGPIALAPLTVIDNGSVTQIAFLSQPGTTQRVSFVNFNGTGQSGAISNFNVPAGSTLSDLTWINSQFLVARATSAGTPGSRLVRIDRTNPNSPFRDLTIGVNVVSGPRRSGNGDWISFVVSRPISGNTEQSAAIMHTGAIASPTQPGGSYTIVSPLQFWNYTVPPFVQQSGTSLQPNIFFAGAGAGFPGQGVTFPTSFYRTSLLREVSVAGRIEAGAPGSNLTFNVDCSFTANDAIWVLGLSFTRTNTPGAYLASPTLADPVNLTLLPPTPPGVASLPITLPVSPVTPWTPRDLFLQAVYIDLQNNLSVSRVTELPIF